MKKLFLALVLSAVFITSHAKSPTFSRFTEGSSFAYVDATPEGYSFAQPYLTINRDYSHVWVDLTFLKKPGRVEINCYQPRVTAIQGTKLTVDCTPDPSSESQEK